MILLDIEPVHFGPFSSSTRLRVESDVTVLTGANDTGKTAMLRAIFLLCTGTPMDERELNRDRIGHFTGAWGNDPEIACTASFRVTDKTISEGYARGDVEVGDTISVRTRLNQQGLYYQVLSTARGQQPVSRPVQVDKAPSVLWLPNGHGIREVIDFANMNPAEQSLIRLGFGGSFSFEHHRSLSEINRFMAVSEAQERLNDKLKAVLPAGLPFTFYLREFGEKPQKIGVSLIDSHKGHTPLGSRGAGVQRLLTLMGSLLSTDLQNKQTIILFDEPETSLHADAQHALRRVLEKLGALPTVQVIYSTHSPAMINTLRPRSIRVLRRDRRDERATSVVENNAFDRNYFLVRSSLGVTPADSLLYAPVTVVVEGASEVRSLPIAIERLHTAKVAGFSDAEDLLDQIHFLDGGGDQFEYMCRLSKSQNAKPVIFLDGDKQRAAESVNKVHPDVPIVTLEEHQEFENLVPLDVYLAAISQVHEIDPALLTVEAYLNWESAQNFHGKRMLSKRVDHWLPEKFGVELNKPRVMEEAICKVPLDKLIHAPLRRLLDEVRKRLV